MKARRPVGLGHPLYVNGHLYQEPVTISHVPGAIGNYYDVPAGLGAVDPSMGAFGAYVAYAPQLGAEELPGASAASLPPDSTPDWARSLRRIYSFIAPATGALGIYHGYKRNDSVGWALWWGLTAAAFPIITIPIALAQGFGKKKGMMPNKRRRRRNPAAGKSLDVAINKAIDQARYADAPRYLTKSGATYFVEWSPTRGAVRVSRTDSVEAVKRRWQEKHG